MKNGIQRIFFMSNYYAISEAFEETDEEFLKLVENLQQFVFKN